MKSIIIYLFLILGLNYLYSQNTDLNQFTMWHEKSYENVDVSLLRYGWEKFNRSTSSTCKNYQYILYKGLQKQQIVTLIYTSDYKIENNILSYNAIKDWKYDRLISELKSFGYKNFKSLKFKGGTSNYYQLNNNVAIVTVYKSKEEQFQGQELFTVYMTTDGEYFKTHK